MSASTKPWPWHGDSPVARARKVALAYRAIAVTLLNAAMKAGIEVDPHVLRDADERFMKWGEAWLDTGPVTYDDDDMVIASVAGPLIGVAGGTLHVQRARGRIRGVWDDANHCFKYRVGDVLALSTELRGRSARSTDKVSSQGEVSPK